MTPASAEVVEISNFDAEMKPLYLVYSEITLYSPPCSSQIRLPEKAITLSTDAV